MKFDDNKLEGLMFSDQILTLIMFLEKR